MAAPKRRRPAAAGRDARAGVEGSWLFITFAFLFAFEQMWPARIVQVFHNAPPPGVADAILRTVAFVNLNRAARAMPLALSPKCCYYLMTN
jgi:hypothetical protein